MIAYPLDTSGPLHDDKANQRRNAALKVALARRSTLHSHAAGTTGYVPSAGLVTAINVAVAACSPLLVTGEPGTGKTQAGYYAAKAFGLKEPTVFSVRSVSAVRDLLYEFDAIAYLRSAYEVKAGACVPSRASFIRRGPLWRALASVEPVVLIIDEIDKAPKDFPNDLLHVLDQFWFDVPELDGLVESELIPFFGQELENGALYRPTGQPGWRLSAEPWPRSRETGTLDNAIRRPLVFITSNDERRLPEAFLRRCVFHHIVLTRGLVEAAVAARRAEFSVGDATVVAAISAMAVIRKVAGLRKKVSLGELLVWLRVLSIAQVDSGAILDSTPAELPCVGAIVKDPRDLAALRSEVRTVRELVTLGGARSDSGVL